MKDSELIRIAHFPGSLDFGGVGSILMGLYRSMDTRKVQFDFYVNRTEKGPFDDEIESMGGRIFLIPKIREIGIIKYFNHVQELLKNNGSYEAIHIHAVHNGSPLVLLARKIGIKKIIYHVHNTNDTALKRFKIISKFMIFISKRIIKKFSTHLCACGEEAAKYVYGRTSLENNKIIIINNAVDLKKYRPYSAEEIILNRDTHSIPKNELIIGNAARFVAEKNQAYLINIVKVLNETQPTTLILAGDGEKRAECEKLAIDLGLEKKVIFLGNQRNMAMVYNLFDIFVLPSIFEGFPVSIVEAQACGVSSIMSTNVTSEADFGLGLVKSISLNDSPQYWAMEILNIKKKRIDEKEIAINFGNRGFNLKKEAEKLEEIYIY